MRAGPSSDPGLTTPGQGPQCASPRVPWEPPCLCLSSFSFIFSISLSLRLCLCLPACLYFCFPISLPLPYLRFSLNLSLTSDFYLCLFLGLSVSIPISHCLCLPLSASISLFLLVSVCQSLALSIHIYSVSSLAFPILSLTSSCQIHSRLSLAPPRSAPTDMRVWPGLSSGGAPLRARGGGPSPGGSSPACFSCIHSSIVSAVASRTRK